MSYNDIKDIFFPETLPELDNDIRGENSDFDISTITPLEDAKDLIESYEIEEENNNLNSIVNQDSIINPPEIELQNQLKILSISFHRVIEYYNKLFPERFGQTLSDSIDMLNFVLNDNDISIKDKINIIKELINQYRLEAIKQLDERSIKIMDTIKSNFESIENKEKNNHKQGPFHREKTDKFRKQINPDDFVDY